VMSLHLAGKLVPMLKGAGAIWLWEFLSMHRQQLHNPSDIALDKDYEKFCLAANGN
jgi:hypothetical protein